MARHAPSCSVAAHRFQAAVCPTGCWRLKPGHALGLRPLRTAELRLVRGRVWATLGQPDAPGHQGTRAGDVFLRAGEVMTVPAGARLVVEALNPLDLTDVLFEWCEVPAASGTQQADRFRREVLLPATDLAVALRQVLRASASLVRGLLGYGEFVVAGRGRVLAPLEGNPP